MITIIEMNLQNHLQNHLCLTTDYIETQNIFNWNIDNWSLEIVVFNISTGLLIEFSNLKFTINTDSKLELNGIISGNIPCFLKDHWYKLIISKKKDFLELFITSFTKDGEVGNINLIAKYKNLFDSLSNHNTNIKMLNTNIYISYLLVILSNKPVLYHNYHYYNYNKIGYFLNNLMHDELQFISKHTPFSKNPTQNKYLISNYDEYKRFILDNNDLLEELILDSFNTQKYINYNT